MLLRGCIRQNFKLAICNVEDFGLSKELRILLYVLRRQGREIFFTKADNRKVTGDIAPAWTLSF